MAHPDPMSQALEVPRDPCRATNRQGQPCGQPAIPGGQVCRFHGGDAPQVRRAAERRLAALASRVLDRWAQAMADDEVPWAIKVQVGRDILDRLGVGADERSAASGRTTVSLHHHQATLAPDLDAIIAAALERSAAQSRAYLDRQSEAASRYASTEDAEVVEEEGSGGTGDALAEGDGPSPALPDAGEQGGPPPPSPPLPQ